MEIDDPNVHMLRNADAELRTSGVSLLSAGIVTGRNSGYQVVNIGVLAGMRRGVLVAYDMRFRDGKSHWFGDHPVKNVEGEFAGYARNFRALITPLAKLGVEMINATPGSAIDAFPRMELCDALTA